MDKNLVENQRKWIQIRIPKWLTKIKEKLRNNVLKRWMLGTVGFSWSFNIR
jgi:hypothetical protein